jgi:uncharacterized protein YciI
MNTTLKERLQRLRAPQLKKRLYIALWINDPTATRDEHLQVLPEHLEFLLGLEQQGVLFASGPLSVNEGETGIFSGMTILRAESFEMAKAIVENEPFVVRGLRTYKLLAWELNEGSFSVTLSLGTGTFRVP